MDDVNIINNVTDEDGSIKEAFLRTNYKEPEPVLLLADHWN
jgi:hypothetical protein